MVTFKGITFWEPVALPEWSVDNWGMDKARVLCRGRAPLKEQFEDVQVPWSKMPGFAVMRLENWSSTIVSPSFPGVELMYSGFRSGKIPNVKRIDDTSLQSAQAEGTDTVTQKRVSGSFQYKASRSTYIWFETIKPSRVPRYATVANPLDPFQGIISYSLTDEDGQGINSIPYSAFVAVFNRLARATVVSCFSSEELIPDTLWGCRCDVDYKLIN